MLDCLAQLALSKALAGSLQDAARCAHSAIELATRRGWDDGAGVAPAFLALAISHVYWARARHAEQHLSAAQHAARRSQSRTTVALIMLFRAVLDARSDVAAGGQSGPLAAPRYREWQLPSSLAVTAGFFEAWLLAEAGESRRSRAALARGDIASKASLEAALVQARLALAGADVAEALRQLEAYGPGDCSGQHPACAIEALALAAVAHHLLARRGWRARPDRGGAGSCPARGLPAATAAVGAPLLDLLRRRIRAGTRQRTFADEIISLLEDPARSIVATRGGYCSTRCQTVRRPSCATSRR